MNRDYTILTLRKHFALTIDMADAFVRGEPRILFSDDHAVYIIHGCGIPMLWADDVEAAKAALYSAEEPFECVIHGTPAHIAFNKVLHFSPDASCIQYCRLNRGKLPVADVCEIKTLTEADLPFIMRNYHRAGNPDYILWRIREGEMQGAYVDGELVGFIGSHMDGSIGMLEVLDEFRHHGIGTALEAYQINRHIDKGWVPYGQVFTDNISSLQLQRRMGLDYSCDVVSWAFNDGN